MYLSAHTKLVLIGKQSTIKQRHCLCSIFRQLALLRCPDMSASIQETKHLYLLTITIRYSWLLGSGICNFLPSFLDDAPTIIPMTLYWFISAFWATFRDKAVWPSKHCLEFFCLALCYKTRRQSNFGMKLGLFAFDVTSSQTMYMYMTFCLFRTP